MEGLEKRTWKEFQSSGLLWFVNRLLHLFGWAIVLSIDDDTGEIKNCYPAHVTFRGFPYDVEEEGFRRLTDTMKHDIDRMYEGIEQFSDSEERAE